MDRGRVTRVQDMGAHNELLEAFADLGADVEWYLRQCHLAWARCVGQANVVPPGGQVGQIAWVAAWCSGWGCLVVLRLLLSGRCFAAHSPP